VSSAWSRPRCHCVRGTTARGNYGIACRVPQYLRTQLGKIHARDQRQRVPLLEGRARDSPTIPQRLYPLWRTWQRPEGATASHAACQVRVPVHRGTSTSRPTLPPGWGIERMMVGWIGLVGWVGDNMTRLRSIPWADLSRGKTCFGPDRPSPQPIGGHGGDLAGAKNGANAGGTHWRPEIWDNLLAWPVVNHASIQFTGAAGHKTGRTRRRARRVGRGGGTRERERVRVGSHEPCSRVSRRNALGRTTLTNQPSPFAWAARATAWPLW